MFRIAAHAPALAPNPTPTLVRVRTHFDQVELEPGDAESLLAYAQAHLGEGDVLMQLYDRHGRDVVADREQLERYRVGDLPGGDGVMYLVPFAPNHVELVVATVIDGEEVLLTLGDVGTGEKQNDELGHKDPV
jgi:hypothetical protein